MEPRQQRGIQEPTWTATIVRQLSLCYSAGALPAADRPAWVRSGSGMAWYGKRLAIAQDDANFIALLDPECESVEAIALPAGHDGKRQFDDQGGNKRWKLDLESCFSFRPAPGNETWMGFGSGSSPLRESIVMLESTEELDPRIRVIEASRFYQLLRQEKAFSGSELNMEGVALLPSGMLRLFQRGNGAAVGGLQPVNATVDIRLDELLAFLEDPAIRPVPALHNIVQYEIGCVVAIRFTFTDAVEHEGSVYFLVAAEDSPDTIRDGAVVGAAIGILDAQGVPRWTHLRDAAGKPFLGKAEGLAFDRKEPGKAYIVIDPDNSEVPSQLCHVELRGFQR